MLSIDTILRMFPVILSQSTIKKSRPVSRVPYLAVSIIYLVCRSLHSSSDLPPNISRAGLSVSVHGLATREMYGYSGYPEYRWALTPPFHPYSTEGTVFFCYITISFRISSR